MNRAILSLLILTGCGSFAAGARGGETMALPLRIAAIAPAATQPQAHDRAVIFYDDFDTAPAAHEPRYFEYDPAKGSFEWAADGGVHGGGMRCQFDKGQVTAGSLKVLFGKNPFGRGVHREETFREIYWRVYVKHENGWEGNPAKLARATCLAGTDWSQGMIAHVWGGKGDVLCIDPATGIRDGVKVTTHYNDFDKLKWLGLRNGQTPIFSPEESGRWVCVESHIKLNAPGREDGLFELWVEGRPEAARTNLDWCGTWQDFGIDAVFLENYWNQGSGKRQARWFDNFVISTQPIGPISAERPPTLTRTLEADHSAWELEVAGDAEGKDLVWKSKSIDGAATSLTVDGIHGEFSGSCAGKSELRGGATYWTRIRRTGENEWGPWQTPFLL